MTTSHGRRIQSRRALAIMAWISLVVIAGLLWYGQENGIIRIQAWEPAALLLSAYSAFLAIFGWLLFAPERRSAEESPALFFSGMLTLIPPCFIAYHLMPPSSPLRGWLTLGIFVFGLIAILSPLPDEVFAVPRDRKSYLQPLTDCYLSALNVEEPQLDLQSLVPRSYQPLSGLISDRKSIRDTGQSTSSSGTARDPWTDPFYGTGRSLSEVGTSRKSTYSESRSRSSDTRTGSALLREPISQPFNSEAISRGPSYRDASSREATIGNGPGRDSSLRDGYQNEHRDRPQTQTHELSRGPVHEFSPPSLTPLLTPPPLPPAIPSVPTTSGFPRPPMIARSAFAPRESRAPNFQPATASPPATPESSAITNPASTVRRPLTEPGDRSTPAVGFQSPPISRPITSSPPPAPSYLDSPPASATTPRTSNSSTTSTSVPKRPQSDTNRSSTTNVTQSTGASTLNRSALNPQSPPVVPQQLSAASAPLIADRVLGLGSMTAGAPLASSATFDDGLKSAVAEFTTVTEPSRPVQKTAEVLRPLLDDETRLSDSSLSNPRLSTPAQDRSPATNVFELDRRIKEEEAQDLQEIDSDINSTMKNSTMNSAVTPTTRTSPLSDVKMERIKDEYGGEMVDGTIGVFFEVGQKRAHLHVPFSPPLEGLPEVECEAINDDSVRCKVAVRQPYGIRIEARRSDASRALNTEIGFAAVYTPSSRRS
jgi:hypothetical protein